MKSRPKHNYFGFKKASSLMVPVILGSTFIYSNTVFAQDESPQVIEEVMVTATKRASSLQDTGIAISVLGSDEMQFRDMNNLEDMENAVPGLKIGTVLGTPLINIRGIGLNFISGLGNPGVATHADGVYMPRTGSVNAASVDLERVEVLRGPQGTLYGRNATGGSINFVSKRPGDVFGAGVTVGAGEYGREIYETYVEGPIMTDKLGARIYWRADQFDGYGINETSGKSVGGNAAEMGHLSLTYFINDAVDVSASYVRREDRGRTFYSTAMTLIRPLLQPVGSEYPASLQTFIPYNYKGYVEPLSEKSTEVANVTVNWNFSDYNFKSVTGYVTHERYENGSAPSIQWEVVDLFRREDSTALSQEFNLSSDSWFDGRLNWLVGAYYQVDDGHTPIGSYIHIYEIIALPTTKNRQLVFNPASKTKDKSQAVFLDGYWAFADNLRLIFGIRDSKETRDFEQTFEPYVKDSWGGLHPDQTAFAAALFGSVIESCNKLKNTKEFKSTDPKLGVEWEITPDVMVYAQYQTGFKAGGFDTSTGCNETYEPEEIKAYEVGVKSTLMDGALTMNAAAFSYDYTDYQVDRVQGFESIIENAASASSNGFELEGVYTPTPWVTVDAQFSYLDAQYDSYYAQDNFKNSTTIAGDAPMEDLSGNTLSRSPKYTFNMGMTFFHYIGAMGLGNAQLRLERFWSDDVYFREFNEDIEKQGKYSTYNAFLSINSQDERYTLSLFVKNIGDERYLVGEIPFDSIFYRGAYYAPPKTWGATFSAKM